VKRDYPTYILSKADNVKVPGIYIARLTAPRLIARVENGIIVILEIFQPLPPKYTEESLLKHLTKWYNHSGVKFK
jgi:hypothetical protein